MGVVDGADLQFEAGGGRRGGRARRGSAPGGIVQGGADALLPVLQGGLIAAVGHVLLSARREAGLDALAGGEILFLHGT